MNIAAFLLLALIAGLFVFDWTAHRGRNRRVLWLEGLAFACAGFFIALPDRATELAHLVGIGRGVDFLLYPVVLWLVRESLVGRRRRLEDEERLTELARAVAIVQARRIEAPAAGAQAS